MGSKPVSAGVGEMIEIQLQETSAPRHVQKPLRPGVLITIVAAAVALVWLLVLVGRPAMEGAQVEGNPEIRMARASEMTWHDLVSRTGEERPGFPEPMVSRADHICIGFGRVDFTREERRPSVARCVEPPELRSVGPGAIATLMTLASGLDTWHFLEAATPVDRVRVEMAEGETLSLDRIYVSGSTFALRLPNERELREIAWSSGSREWRCAPEPSVWQTSVFCPS
ncbi:MAG: hypothetical protein R8J94_03760 [Acidimicrobiia bacterium]|nr:hypothetical protein [Acidimicrobiia bacterium]